MIFWQRHQVLRRRSNFSSLRWDAGAAPARVGFTLAVGALLSFATGCRQDMQDQPKFTPQRGSSFYADGRSVRPQVPNTIARSQDPMPEYFETGRGLDGAEGDGMPFPVTPEVLARGQEQYNIYCSPCHSRTGYGHGRIVERGYYPAASMHTDRLRQIALGHFFNVITNGYGAMPSYSAQVSPVNRWAVAAYIRALQLSQHAGTSDLPGNVDPVSLDKLAEQQGLEKGFADMGYWKVASTASAAPAAPSTPAASPGALPPTDASSSKTPAATPAKGSTTPAAEVAASETHAGNAAAGRGIYEANCSVCHQASFAGVPSMFPALTDVVKHKGAEQVRAKIVNGALDARPMMPAFGERLSATEIDNVVAYLKANAVSH